MIELTSLSEFEKLVVESNLVMLDFYAEWCGPCKRIKQFYENLSKMYPQIKFAKVNVDEAEDIATRFNVSSLPTFILFRNGEKFKRIEGASEPSLLTAIKSVI